MQEANRFDLRPVLGKRTNLLLLALLVIFVLRIIFVGLMGLMPQDAYYHFYGQNLALSYFDHPPAIAYLLRFFTDVFGEKVFVVKMADTVVTLLSLVSFYQLCKCFLSTNRAFVACILLFSTLMITTLSLVSTPDVPLILFWTLSLLTLYQAIFRRKRLYWLLSGLMMGFAFDSKYTGIFLPAGLVLFILISANHRRLLLSPWFWMSLVIFLVTISPVIWWNWAHQFASFKFQTEGRVKSGLNFDATGFFGVLGHQSAILMPILFFALLWLSIKVIRKYFIRGRHISDTHLFLYSFFIPVFVSFLAISFFYWVKLNWMMPAYISGVILLSIYLSKKWIRYQLLFSVAVHVVMAIEIAFYPVPVRSDDTWFGWEQLARKVGTIESQYPSSFVFAADDYKTSAVLNFYSDSMVYSRNVIGENALQFDYVGTDLNRLKGRNALFLNSMPRFTDTKKEHVFPEQLPDYFDSIKELDPILIDVNGRHTRKFLVFYCQNYHPKAVGSKYSVGTK